MLKITHCALLLNMSFKNTSMGKLGEIAFMLTFPYNKNPVILTVVNVQIKRVFSYKAPPTLNLKG